MIYHAKAIAEGKIVIPADLGRAFDIKGGLALGQRHHPPVLTGGRHLAAIDPALGTDERLSR